MFVYSNNSISIGDLWEYALNCIRSKGRRMSMTGGHYTEFLGSGVRLVCTMHSPWVSGMLMFIDTVDCAYFMIYLHMSYAGDSLCMAALLNEHECSHVQGTLLAQWADCY